MEKLVCTNRSARKNYSIDERFEAGIVLKGTEVKSLRDGKASINDSYADFKHGTFFLINSHINEYTHGNITNHKPLRERKLLLNKSEIKRLMGKVNEKGFTLIPLKLYFKDGWVKVEIGLAKGKKKTDRRDELKRRDVQREFQREFKGKIK